MFSLADDARVDANLVPIIHYAEYFHGTKHCFVLFRGKCSGTRLRKQPHSKKFLPFYIAMTNGFLQNALGG